MARPNKSLIEPRFRESLDAYIRTGRPTGDWLLAVLENNLKEAIARGDEDALDNLPHVVAFLYNDAPSACWGSPEEVRLWQISRARAHSVHHATHDAETCIDCGGDAAGPDRVDR